MRGRRVLLSTVNLLASVACLGTLYACVAPTGHDLFLFSLLEASSQGVSGVMLYYVLWHFVRSCCTSRQWRRRVRDWLHGTKHGHVVYTSSGYVDEGATTDLLQGVPRLTMDSVWNLVYGLGCGLYVCTYTLMGLDPVCIASFTFGLCMVCAYEVVFPPVFRVIPRVELHLTPCVALVSLVSTVLVAGERFSAPDSLSTAVYQLVLPCLAPFFLLSVKSQRRFTIGSIMETCEFGLPHAFILALGFLVATAIGTGEPASLHRGLPSDNNATQAPFPPLVQATPAPLLLQALTHAPTTPAPLLLQALTHAPTTPAPMLVQTLTHATTTPAPMLVQALTHAPATPAPMLLQALTHAPATPAPTLLQALTHAPATPAPTLLQALTRAPLAPSTTPVQPQSSTHTPTPHPAAAESASWKGWLHTRPQRTLLFTLLAPLAIAPATLLVVGAVLQYRTADVIVCLGLALACKEALAASKGVNPIPPANAWGLLLIALAFMARLFSRLDTETPSARPSVTVVEEGGEETNSLV